MASRSFNEEIFKKKFFLKSGRLILRCQMKKVNNVARDITELKAYKAPLKESWSQS